MNTLHTTQETANRLLDDLAELYVHATVSVNGIPNDEIELELVRRDCEEYAKSLFCSIMAQYEERFEGVWDIKTDESYQEEEEKSPIKKLKDFLKEEFPDRIQMFDCRNTVGDIMSTIYNDDGIIVDYCCGWEYIEVFGLTKEQFNEVMKECGY